MKHLHFALLALASFTCALSACDAAEPEDDFRSVVVKDSWGLHDPASFPEVNSCVDYWNDRCADLTPSQCTVAKNRYTCTSSAMGVDITDSFGTHPSAVSWAAIGREDEAGFVVEDLQIACTSMEGGDLEQCFALAEITETLAAALPELMELSPGGGVGSIVIQDDLMRVEAELPELEGLEDLGWDAADALSWTVPLLREGLALENPAGVFEDNVILMVRPNGTLSVSTSQVVFMMHPAD